MTWTKSYTYLGDGVLSTISKAGSSEITEFNHPDRLGTRVITNQALGTNYEQTTLPFGTALNAESSVTSLSKRFTSYERSAQTGLDYAVNRTYDSKQGRFTQVDPIGMSATKLGSPQTLNLYSYCGNDPINHTDPDGLFFGSFFKWLGKAFKAFNKILKWVVVAIAVVAVAIAVFHSGGAAAAFLKWIFAAIGKFAFKSSFLAITGTATEASIGLGIGGKIAAGLYGIGAIASKFPQKQTAEQKRRDIIKQTVTRVISRLKNITKCLSAINHDGYSLSPADAISEIDDRGNIVFNKDLDVSAQTTPNQTNDGVIDLGPSFFKEKIKDGRGNDWNKITGLNAQRTREFIILHELRHLYGSDHSREGGIERDVTEILKDCFGVTPDLSGGIK